MDLRGFQWISMDSNGFQWISMDIYRFLWISMDFDGFPLVEMDEESPRRGPVPANAAQTVATTGFRRF